MSSFTDYLLSNGHISEEQLLLACVEQLEATPTLAAVVLHHGLLKPGEQLSVLRKQEHEGLSYQQACLALGFWTEDLAAAVAAEVATSRPALAQILANKGLISAATIHLLQSVAAMQHQLTGTSQDDVRAEFALLDQVLVDEYSLLFKTEDYQHMVEACTTMPLLPSPERKQALETILEQIQSAHRGVNFLGFKSVEGLLNALLQLLQAMQAATGAFNSGDKEVLQAGLTHFWQLSPSHLNKFPTALKRAS